MKQLKILTKSPDSLSYVMPANLPPQYREIEKKFREARNPSDKLAFLREMLSIIPKHKGTERLQGDLKKRISKLQNQLQKSSKVGRRPYGFSVQKEGAAQVVLLGPANSGKSSILETLTRAEPEVAAYPFTTRKPMPGMMQFEDIQIQLVDMPPILEGEVEHWFVQLVQSADAALVILDVASPTLLEDLELVQQQLAGGKIVLKGTTGQDEQMAEGEGAIFVKRALVVGNKTDLEPHAGVIEVIEKSLGKTTKLVPFSAIKRDGVDVFKRQVFEMLDLVRIYTKAPGKKPDLGRPFVLAVGSTILDVAGLVHKDFRVSLKSARLWGSGSFDGQYVHRDHVVQDGDVVELHL